MPSCPICSVNQTFLSGPTVMPVGELLAVGVANSVICPFAGLILPTLPGDASTNQRLPSGADTMWPGLPPEGMGKLWKAWGAMSNDTIACEAVNQSWLSGPTVMSAGSAAG